MDTRMTAGSMIEGHYATVEANADGTTTTVRAFYHQPSPIVDACTYIAHEMDTDAWHRYEAPLVAFAEALTGLTGLDEFTFCDDVDSGPCVLKRR